jgi:outer membrane protein TolC
MRVAAISRATIGSLIVLTGASAVGAQVLPKEPVPTDSIRAIPGAAARPGVSLRRCLELAERNYPKIREAEAKRAQKAALVDVVKYAPFSEFSVSGGLILAPSVSGTADYSRSTDTALTRNMGLAWQMGVEGALPLYTFGKITNAIKAAEAGARVGEHEVDKERNDLRLNVRRAYYGVQLARDALALIDDAASQMDRHIAKLKKQVDEGDGDDIQLLKVQVFRADLAVRRSEAVKQETVALSALRFLTGQDSTLDVPNNEPLQAETLQLEPLSAYLAMAQVHRPELGMARAAVAARKSQVKLETSKFFPDLGLGLTAKWAYAPEVTDQTNPFVRDNGNFLLLAAGLVLKYKLDFVPQSARLSQAKSQLSEVLATEQWAKSGIAQQVSDAYAEVRDTENRLTVLGEATKLAKQWLLKVQQGIDVGTMDDEEIVMPAKEFALKRIAEMMAIYDYNVALAKLSQTTGVSRNLSSNR